VRRGCCSGWRGGWPFSRHRAVLLIAASVADRGWKSKQVFFPGENSGELARAIDLLLSADVLDVQADLLETRGGAASLSLRATESRRESFLVCETKPPESSTATHGSKLTDSRFSKARHRIRRDLQLSVNSKRTEC
jgi:hypothetical protein